MAGLSPAVVAEREQAERKEQQWQKENVATAHNEHDQGNCKADSKHTYQTDPSKQCLAGPTPQPAPNERGAGAHLFTLRRFAFSHLAPPGACFLVAVLDQLLEPLEIAAHLIFDDA
jgi:hypothetical protein